MSLENGGVDFWPRQRPTPQAMCCSFLSFLASYSPLKPSLSSSALAPRNIGI